MTGEQLSDAARRALVAGESVTGTVLDHFAPANTPAGVFDLLNYDADAVEGISVLAGPGERLQQQPREGDLIVERVRGERDDGRLAVLAADGLAERAEVVSRGRIVRDVGPGLYAETLSDSLGDATRLTDSTGVVASNRMLIRPEADFSRPTFETAAPYETGAEAWWQGERWPGLLLDSEADPPDTPASPSASGSIGAISVASCVPAPEPDPSGRGPHPLLLRGSHRASVGYAQQCLNTFISRYQAGTFTCTDPAPGVRALIDSALATLRANGQLPLQIDCRFGANTERATKAFQACSGIARDGRIGPITWPLLDALAPTTPPTPSSSSLTALERRYFPPTGTQDAAPFSRAATITPIIDGRDYFAAIRSQIGALGAGDALYLAGWWLNPNFRFADGSVLADLLINTASSGVDVRVIVWANRQVLDNPRLAGRLGAAAYTRVIRENIQAAELLRSRTDASGHRPLAGRVLIDWSGNAASSHHMKFTVIAHESQLSAFVGGIDYQQNRLDAPTHRSGVNFWHDAGVRLGGDAANRALETFVTRWTEASTLSATTYDIGGGPKPYNPVPIVPLTPPSSSSGTPASLTTSVQVMRSFPDSKEFGLLRNTPWATLPRSGVHETKRTFQTALAAAQRYIYIEDQSFDAVNSLFPSLIAACRRGVKVIAVLPGSGDPLDAPGIRPHALSREVVDGLVNHLSPAEQGNLAVWQLDGIIVHSKLVLIDDEYLSIGSANFMDRSMQFTLQGDDSELTAAAVSTSGLVRDLRTSLWAEHLRVSHSAALTELADLGKSLGFWRPSWGTGITFPHPDTRLVFVGPTPSTGHAQEALAPVAPDTSRQFADAETWRTDLGVSEVTPPDRSRSTFALLRAIPDDPDYRSHIPIDYRLDAKSIVGELAQDLGRGQSAHMWVELAHLGMAAAEGAEIIAATSALAAGLAIASPILGMIGVFLEIGSGYQEAAEQIAKDKAASGFSRGAVMGADRRTAHTVIELFGHDALPANAFFPRGREIAIANYRVGLLAGYTQGRALSHNQRQIFWRDLGHRIGDQSWRGPQAQWSPRDWQDAYLEQAAVFRRDHLRSTS